VTDKHDTAPGVVCRTLTDIAHDRVVRDKIWKSQSYHPLGTIGHSFIMPTDKVLGNTWERCDLLATICCRTPVKGSYILFSDSTPHKISNRERKSCSQENGIIVNPVKTKDNWDDLPPSFSKPCRGASNRVRIADVTSSEKSLDLILFSPWRVGCWMKSFQI
jgi:hypothetical protein